MTYSLTLMGTHHCKPNTCYERIPSISGLLEEVLDGVVVFHDVEQKDIKKSIDYLASRYGHDSVSIESEHYSGCYCETKLIRVIKI